MKHNRLAQAVTAQAATASFARVMSAFCSYDGLTIPGFMFAVSRV